MTSSIWPLLVDVQDERMFLLKCELSSVTTPSVELLVVILTPSFVKKPSSFQPAGMVATVVFDILFKLL